MSTEIGFFKHPQRMIKALVGCLNQLIEESPVGEKGSLFDLKAAPTISIGDYVTRMVKYMNASLSVYIYSLILLDRAQEYNPEFVIHKKNIHRLLLVSNLVAAKYLDDLFYKNSFYATVGGVTLKVINELQSEFLDLINFNCHFERVTFDSYLERLQLYAEINFREETLKENRVLANEKPLLQQTVKRRQEKQQKTECITGDQGVRYSS